MRYSTILVIALNLFFAIPVTAQSNALFTINGSHYFVTPNELNDIYGRVFNKLVSLHTCKEKDFELWTKSFQVYKSMVINGTQSWEVYHDKIANYKYTGASSVSDADLGLIKGKVANGNPNKKSNHAARMALLNLMMAEIITAEYRNKDTER